MFMSKNHLVRGRKTSWFALRPFRLECPELNLKISSSVKPGLFCLFGGPVQDAVLGPFCQTMMDRLLTLLGQSQRCTNLLSSKRKTG